MKLLGLLLLSALHSFGAYAITGTIDINPAKLGGSDQTDFTFCLCGTYPELATVANGGNVQNLVVVNGIFVPADLLLTYDLAGINPLKIDIFEYNETTGYIRSRPLVASVSHTVSTRVYIHVGDAAIISYQGGATGEAYGASCLALYHFTNIGGSVDTRDACGSGFDGTNHGATVAIGKIGGGAEFDGTSQYISTTGVALGTTHTISFWMDYQSPADSVPVGGADSGGGFLDYLPYVDDSGGSGTIYYRNGFTGFNAPVFAAHGGVNSGLAHIVIVRSGTSVSFYKNGAILGTTQVLGANHAITMVSLGAENSGELFFKGILDEVGFDSTAKDGSWVAANHNTESDPSTFYAISFGGAPPTSPHRIRLISQ